MRQIAWLICVLGIATPALADRVDDFIVQLRTAKEYKERVAAAAALAKLADKRSIEPLLMSLNDSDKNVRATAVGALPVVVKKGTKADVARAISALETSLTDSSPVVRAAAQKAIDALAGPVPPLLAGSTFVEFGSMAAKAEEGKSVVADMRRIAVATMAQKAPTFATKWPNNKPLSAKELAAKKVDAFYVDGSISEMRVSKKGNYNVVSCKIDMVIATFPERSMFGFLKGSASVETDPREIEDAKKDCVGAVVEDLIETKVIPTIRTRSQ